MATNVTNYQCPSCTGPLHYVGSSGRLECDYCGSSFDPKEIEQLYAAKEAEAAEAQKQEKKTDTGEWEAASSEDWGADAENMRAYNCPSCGAELICDANTAATSCPYCGNPTVIPGQFSDTLKPEYILPFKLSREDAIAALERHYKGKHFLPRAFRSKKHIEEIRGVYVPFWLFDGEAEGSANYMATTVRVFRRGDDEITETSFYEVQRAGTLPFKHVPVDASTKMPDDHMDSIEPFDYGELKPFSTSYLPGFLADKFDVSIEQSKSRADERCRKSMTEALRETTRSSYPYSTVTPTSEDIHLKRSSAHYALLPVWLLNTKWDGKDFLFAMNGQTGRLVGDLPIDRGLFWLMFAKIAVPLTAVLTVLLHLM